MDAGLTASDKRWLVAFFECLLRNGFPPTNRELADHYGAASTNGCHEKLVRLAERDLLVRPEPSRSVGMVNGKPFHGDNRGGGWVARGWRLTAEGERLARELLGLRDAGGLPMMIAIYDKDSARRVPYRLTPFGDAAQQSGS